MIFHFKNITLKKIALLHSRAPRNMTDTLRVVCNKSGGISKSQQDQFKSHQYKLILFNNIQYKYIDMGFTKIISNQLWPIIVW